MEHGGLNDPDGSILTQHILGFCDLPCVGTQDLQDLLNPLNLWLAVIPETGSEVLGWILSGDR